MHYCLIMNNSRSFPTRKHLTDGDVEPLHANDYDLWLYLKYMYEDIWVKSYFSNDIIRFGEYVTQLKSKDDI